jgi:hypothetical protein
LISIFIVGGLLLTPLVVFAETEQAPISQPLVREGTLAVDLADALRLGTASDEVEAESKLGAVGIAPRNGWIADYPVTPDIVGELQGSVGDAADANRLTMSKDEALKAFQDVLWKYNLAVRPSDQTADYVAGYDNPDSTIINNYYYDEGPPIVTYYAPPPYYYPYYTWVPYPFWWWDFWFPGFFVLVDFHKTVFVHGHRAFISNHFFDNKHHHFGRIDPVSRFHGKTFTGIGVKDTKGFVSSGKGGGARVAIGGSRDRAIPVARGTTALGSGRTMSAPSRNTSVAPAERRTFSAPSVTGRTNAPRSGGDRTFNAPSINRRTSVSPSDRSREFSAPSVDRRTFASPSGGSRTFSSPPAVNKSFSSPSGGRSFSAPSYGGGRSFNVPSASSGRSFSVPSYGGGRSFSAPSVGSGRSFNAPSSGGSRSSGSRTGNAGSFGRSMRSR